mgnify:CR=1 FL=1|tara:strand:- start:41 stop:439 length:399 start_codon:yes stop_codon:yes gene_type:complete
MYKYIKKLTSVVVMFAVIIVFSSSNVYADKKNQKNNPFFLIFASMQVTNLNASAQQDKFSKLQDKLNKIALGNTPYRNTEKNLMQSNGKRYLSDYNEKKEKFELTAEGKKNFKAAKEKEGGDGGDGGDGGHM